MRRLVLTALSLGAVSALLLHSSPGLSQQATTVQINAVDVSAYPAVKVTVTVVDGTQRPLLGLGAEAFAATIGGRSVPLSGVASSSDPGLGIAVVLAFDVSGSMQGAAIVAAKEAGKALIGQLGPEDQATVLAFSDTVSVVQPFTQDRAALNAAIDGLLIGGNTALYDAVVQSAGIQAPPLPRRAVVFLSDGTDFGGASQVDAAGSLAAVQASGVPFFLVGLGELVDQPYLEQLAAASRGQLLLATDPAALSALYESIGSILRHQYVLTLDAGAADGTALSISVTARGSTGTAVTDLQLPGTPVAVSPSATASPAPATAPAVVDDGAAAGSSSSLVPILAVASGAGAIAVMSAMFFWRRRRRAVADAGELRDVRRGEGGAVYQPIDVPVLASTEGAHLLVILPDGPRTVPLGESTTIGYTSECSVRLDGGGTGRWEAVRIWRREGRYMAHNLSRIGVVLIAGKPLVWAILEDGDELQIGAQKVIFREHAG